MQKIFEPKRLLEVAGVNTDIGEGGSFVAECEEIFATRIANVADAVEDKEATIVMASGPSASGKTTSSHKLAVEMRRRGHKAMVISLDNFFRNLADYPRTADGKIDMEHLHALDVDMVNRCIRDLIEKGSAEVPEFDFKSQSRLTRMSRVTLGEGDIAIIEGIHALNPELIQLVPKDSVFGLYIGLRTEYTEQGKRVVATRDLRISRRMVRDYLFRGHSVQRTLEMWQRLMDGEEQWIKPYKCNADRLLDSSFAYEPGLFAPVLTKLCGEPEQGGEFRDLLERLQQQFALFSTVDQTNVPPDSMLREFIGGLVLPE